jgi:hypothetical protein
MGEGARKEGVEGRQARDRPLQLRRTRDRPTDGRRSGLPVLTSLNPVLGVTRGNYTEMSLAMSYGMSSQHLHGPAKPTLAVNFGN